MTGMKHLTSRGIEAGLDAIRQSPRDEGVVEMIVRRPQPDEREMLNVGELDLAEGLMGDSWKEHDRSNPNLKTQLTVMNSRAAALVAQDRDRWQLAGDQLFVDLDLSGGNLPPGTRLALGSAVIEVTDQPHTGCTKFVARFGKDAMEFVNSPRTRAELRGINARIVQPGVIRVGDRVRK